MMVEVRDAVELTSEEEAVFAEMLETVRTMGRGVILRAAGGWVRDKLLGRPSKDIDIAVEGCTGSEFAAALQTRIAGSSHVSVIRSNPEQSKHLETATLRVHGIDIDVSALRTDDYSADVHSRIPRVCAATPQEDAARRDLTINALFYRLDTRIVEDWTGRGVADLRAGVVRTPLEPLVTFTDDPLRVLRSVRFAARLGFALDSALLSAAAQETVISALREKISKERIGKELALMLGGLRAGFALQTIASLGGLWTAVFALPEDVPQWDTTRIAAALEFGLRMEHCLDHTVRETDPERRRWLLLSAVLYPLREFEHIGPKHRRIPVATCVLLESLKYANKDVAQVGLLTSSAHDFARLALVDGVSREQLGMIVRKAAGEWRYALRLAAAVVCNEGLAEKFVQIESGIVSLGLVDAHEMKPLFTGQELAALFGTVPGPWVARALDREIEWQFAHPGSPREECQAWLLSVAASMLH